MLCVNCEHFEILYEPYKVGGQLVDWGLAKCKKHDLEVDFINHKKFDWLKCIEEDER